MKCKYLGGCLTKDVCKAGVRYKDVAKDSDSPGWVYRLPCLSFSGYHAEEMQTRGVGICSKFEERGKIMKDKFEALLASCDDDCCTCEQFEAAFADELNQELMAGPFGIINVIRFIRDNWSMIEGLTKGRIGRLIRFVIQNWDKIQDIIDNAEDLGWMGVMQAILELISDFINDRDQMILGMIAASNENVVVSGPGGLKGYPYPATKPAGGLKGHKSK